MSDYRRWRVEGGTYFFTLVTHDRRPFLTSPLARRCLIHSLAKTRARWPFRLIAMVLLPDHLHVVCELPRGDSNYPTRLRRFKEDFTREFLARGGHDGHRNASRISQGERAIWQRRFWEHAIESEEELNDCVNYVHFNPVKHGLVSRVFDWRWSTFHRFLALGHYDRQWGAADPTPGLEMGE